MIPGITLSTPDTIDARIAVPGSKSYTNRALIAAAIAKGESTLSGASTSADSDVLVQALRNLGVSIQNPTPDTMIIGGTGGSFSPFSGTIDIGPAGTAMRFLAALCAAIPSASIRLCGSARMHQRPIGPLVAALQQAGARIAYRGAPGCPPLHISSPTPLRGGRIEVDTSESSQFLSALLLISPLCSAGLEIAVSGNTVSRSYIDMTLQTLHAFGLDAGYTSNGTILVPPGQSYSSRHYHVEGDASGASYLWALAAISGGSVTVENIIPGSAQGDLAFPSILAQMGCSVQEEARAITVSGPRELRPIEVTMELLPDSAQTLAVVAACAKGRSVIRGLQTLRIKETDRISALHAELGKLGIRSEPGPDYLVIHGGTPTGARIATYEDHRMAMSFAALAAKIPGMRIEHPEVVQKSFPDFWQKLAQIGVTSIGE
jgi:3-phosphoshikimate 1-carboxyvinyltransferase